MPKPDLEIRDEPGHPAGHAMQRTRDLLDEAKAGGLAATLRIYRPDPTVAFGQRDRLLNGFDQACDAAWHHGFAGLLRPAGGRAAAYTPGSLIVDHIEPTAEPIGRTRHRFKKFAEIYRRALASIGVDARVGPVDGEYCPGEYSVSGAGSIKLVGTAQRIVSGAWLFSSVIVVSDSAALRAVLTDVYAALGLEWNPATAGAVDDLVPNTGVDDVRAAVLDEFARTYRLTAPR